MSKANERFVYKIKNLRRHWRNYIASNFIFLESLSDFVDVEHTSTARRASNQPVKYIVFISNLTYDQLEPSGITYYYTRLPYLGGSIFQNTYFVTNEANTITLSTFEWFSSHDCNHPHLYKLNFFDKKSQKWNESLKNYEKFMNYHKCELVMLLPITFDDGFVAHVSGYSIVTDSFNSFIIRGITPEVFQIAAVIHNFSAGFQPGMMDVNYFLRDGKDEPKYVNINGTFKYAPVYFEISILADFPKCLCVSNVVTNFKFLMFVTPAEKYTAYEKFFLPFDTFTWILICVTFFMTFFSIVIINRLSKSTQNLVYGHMVETPIWNVISIFFGISQTQLPNKNFSRFILIIFIFFCLIFRTCFQSKFFEFMTSDPRQPPPKTMGEVIDRNYTAYALQTSKGVAYNMENW